MSETKTETKTRKMTEGNPLTTVLLFAIPMILSNLFQQFYNVIDTIIVGKQLGTDALAAVGSASSITAVFVQLATGLALGGSIVIAQFFGAGKNEKIWQCATTSTIFSASVALVATILIWIFARPLLLLVNTPEEIVSMGVSYLRLYFLGCVPIFIYNALKKKSNNFMSLLISFIIAELFMVIGYYIFEGFMYGFIASLANILFNLSQGIVSIIIALLLHKIIKNRIK